VDVRLFLWMRAGRGDMPWLMEVAIAIARSSWLPLLLVVGAMASRWTHGWAPALLGLAAAGLVQWLGKRAARRFSAARPFSLGLCSNHLDHGSRAGFPSAHAMVMGCVWAYMAHMAPNDPLWLVLGLIALATAWARVHAGAHFPSDVMAGLALGALCGAVTAICLSAELSKDARNAVLHEYIQTVYS
jgi:undecaprenyl-diphosphatase